MTTIQLIQQYLHSQGLPIGVMLEKFRDSLYYNHNNTTYCITTPTTGTDSGHILITQTHACCVNAKPLHQINLADPNALEQLLKIFQQTTQ